MFPFERFGIDEDDNTFCDHYMQIVGAHIGTHTTHKTNGGVPVKKKKKKTIKAFFGAKRNRVEKIVYFMLK